MQKYENGLFSSFTWTDIKVMKDVVKVALPLAFGALLAYAEWEIFFLRSNIGTRRSCRMDRDGFCVGHI